MKQSSVDMLNIRMEGTKEAISEVEFRTIDNNLNNGEKSD